MGRVSIGVGVVIFSSFLSVMSNEPTTNVVRFDSLIIPANRCDDLRMGTGKMEYTRTSGTYIHDIQPQRANYQTILARATKCPASATCYSYDGVYGHQKNYGRFTGLFHGGEKKAGIAIQCNGHERVNTGFQAFWDSYYSSCAPGGETGSLLCVPKKYRKYEIDVLYCPSAAPWERFYVPRFTIYAGFYCPT